MKFNHHKKSKIAIAMAMTAVMGTGIAGCSSQPDSTAVQQAPINNDINSVVKDVDFLFNKSKDDDLEKYSTIYFPSAEENLIELKAMQLKYNPSKTSMFSSGYSAKQINDQANLIRSEVDKAYITKKAIHTHYQEVLDNQAYVKTIDISGFEPLYADVTEQVLEHFESLEKTGSIDAEDKALLLANMKAFEAKVMNAKYHDTLYEALHALPADDIPVSFAAADNTLSALKSTIVNTPRAIEEIEASQVKVIKSVTRAKNVFTEVVWIDENKSLGLEKVALYYRTPIDTALPIVVGEDYSEMAFSAQITAYAKTVSSLEDSIKENVASKDQAEIDKLVQEKIAADMAVINTDMEKQQEADKLQSQQALSAESTALAEKNNAVLASYKEDLQKQFEQEKLALADERKKLMSELKAEKQKNIALQQEHDKSVQEKAALSKSLSEREGILASVEAEVEAAKKKAKASKPKSKAVDMDFDFNIVAPK